MTDQAGNSTPATFELVNDEVGPTVLIDVPPTSGLGVSVSWEGLDIGAGVRHYEVQVKEAGGSWTAWLSDVSYSQATYIGGAGKSYTFQIKATDNVNNESVWVESGSVSVEAVTKYYTFGGQKVAMRRGSEVYYLGGDHLGSTSLTTDSSGGVVSEVRYLPYGQVRWSNGTSVTDFGFTAQRNEASFGLLDYNARYYSAVLGRFVSPDTIVPDPSSSGGFNRYRYTRNNPLRYTNPTGHQCSVTAVTAIDGGRATSAGQLCGGGGGSGFGSAGSNFGSVTKAQLIVDIAEIGVGIGIAGQIYGPQVFASIEEYVHYMDAANQNGQQFDSAGGNTNNADPNDLCNNGDCSDKTQTSVEGTQQSNTLLDGVGKSEARDMLRQGLDGLSDGQTQKVLNLLGKGRVDSFTLNLFENGQVQIISQRAGNDGFQRLIYTLDSSGKTVDLIQKAYNAAGQVEHIHDKINNIAIYIAR